MTISTAEMQALEARVNAKLSSYNAKFVMTMHFSAERINHIRNVPPLAIEELNDLFDRLIEQHIISIVALDHEDTFNIRCLKSDINMPCAVEKTSGSKGSATHKNIIITVMRKKRFKTKDSIEFEVN